MELPNATRYKNIYPVLALILIGVAFISVKLGAVAIDWATIRMSLQRSIAENTELTLDGRIFTQIRLPRAILAIIVGGALAVGGALMQALFRNPIVEPGLVGTSSGAAFGAALYFSLGSELGIQTGEWSVPIAACAGGIVSTYLVFYLARSKKSGRSAIVTLLLTGIAINALFMSGVGFLSYIARDPQARSITFWNLGTLSGANWQAVGIVGLATLICVTIALRYAKQLDALMMGEEEAAYLGVNIKKLKAIILTVNVLLVAIATAFTGVIAFVGLIVPHFLRILGGSNNRYLIIGSLLMGGILLGVSDIAARLIIAPAELPIGIVTSLVGVPVFIYLLRKNNYYF